MPQVTLEKSTTTLATLANAVELVRLVAVEVVGNDIADSIDGSPLTHEVVGQLSISSFMNHLSKFRSN